MGKDEFWTRSSARPLSPGSFTQICLDFLAVHSMLTKMTISPQHFYSGDGHHAGDSLRKSWTNR
jgi:hypothetical protein